MRLVVLLELTVPLVYNWTPDQYLIITAVVDRTVSKKEKGIHVDFIEFFSLFLFFVFSNHFTVLNMAILALKEETQPYIC